MLFELASLVFLTLSFLKKRSCPKGFITCLDFQIRTAIVEAATSFNHRILAFESTTSERILSESLVLVIVRAVALMALLISLVMVIEFLSSWSSLIGMVAGAAARILPINKPFANVDKR